MVVLLFGQKQSNGIVFQEGRFLERLIERLKNQPKEYRSVPFWSWNDKLDPNELRWQIQEMKEKGIGGFFMHARGGLETSTLNNN